MSGSGTIQVRHRTGGCTSFDRHHLAQSFGRVLQPAGLAHHAAGLAEAVELFLRRRGMTLVSSGALVEMSAAALEGLGLQAAAANLTRSRDGRPHPCKGRLRQARPAPAAPELLRV